jgi:hypothetical protein
VGGGDENLETGTVLMYRAGCKNLSDQITTIQGVPGGKVNILGGHSIGHSKQENVYVHVSYSERFSS